MTTEKDYIEFLKSKVRLAEQTGFDVDDSEINPALKPHNRLMVKWLVNGGRRACFASFGLHKTVTQLETIRIILSKTGGRGLIICPLGVRQEFIKDAKNILGWTVLPKFVRRIEECEQTGIYHDQIFKIFKQYSLNTVYDFEHHVRIGEALEEKGKLPVSFMLLQPQSWSDEVWTDITRMLTLNGSQWSKGKEMHLCPMQFDIARRVIKQMSNTGDIVLDPFGGLMTVPMIAIEEGRQGFGIELNPSYFMDGASYCKAAEQKVSMPTLFDLLDGDKLAS